jgi:TolA-binding protein
MLKITKILLLLFLISSIGLTQSKKKEDRGLLPELQTNTNDNESESKSLKSEVLISRTENKAIEALLNILKKKKGTPQEADYLNRLAELYMRKSKTGRFFDLQRDNKNKTMSSFPIPDEKGLDSVKKALEIYERIIKNFPKFEEFDSVLFNSAFALQQLGQKKQSENNYKRLIENFPQSKLMTDSLIALGELLYDQAKFKEAQIYFEKIENYPESKVYSYGLYKLAWTYYNQKQSDLAIKKLKEVIAKNPASDEGVNKKGYYLRKEALRDLVLFIGEVFDAKELYSIFKKITTEDELGQCMFDMAKLYDAYSKLKDIHIFLNEFIENETNNPYIVRSHLLLADTYETLKKRELVLENFSKAAQLCQTGSEWRVHQTEQETNRSCQVEFRRSSLEIAKKWWEIWQKNKLHKEFSILTEKILRLILANENYDDPDLKTRMALAELLFQNENFEESSENYNIVALKTKEPKLSHDSTYSALFAKEKSIEKDKNEIKLAQRKELVQRYLKNFPNGEYFSSVSLKLGIILYEEKSYADSVKILTTLSQNKTDLEIRTKAEDLILDIKNIEKKYSEVKDLSKKFLEGSKDSARKLSLSKINEESHFFEIQEENKKNDKHTSAIKLYEYYKSHEKSDLGKQAFLDSLNILFKEEFYVDATSKGLEFLKAFPKYDKAIELQKEIVKSLVEIAALEKAANVLIELSNQEPKNKLVHLEAAADFYTLEGKNQQARKIYNQLLLELAKDKRPAIFLKIKNTLSANEDKTEIDKIEKIILDQNIEPFVTDLLNKKAQKLFDEKKYSECYELTLKILKRDSDSSARAYARYLQGLIFEKELVGQSVKTSKEDKLGIVIQLKTERLDKAQTAYLGVTKMTTDKKLVLKAFEGIDRSLENYILSLKELAPPPTLSEADQKELKKELEKLVAPLVDKRADYLKEISSMKTETISDNLSWDSLSITTAVPANFARKLNYQLIPLFLNTWPIENNEIKVFSASDYNKSKATDSKAELKAQLAYFANLITTKKTEKANELILNWLNVTQTKNLGLYAASILSDAESKYLKAQWLLEKLKKSNPENINIYKYSLFRIHYNTTPENFPLDKEDLAIISAKSNSSDFTFYQLITSFKFKNYQQTITLCNSLRSQRDLDTKKALKDFILPYCSDALANTGDIIKAEKELDLVPLKEWKNKEYYYLSVARINDLYKKSSESSIKLYDFANKESSSADMKLWISKKIDFLQPKKLDK